MKGNLWIVCCYLVNPFAGGPPGLVFVFVIVFQLISCLFAAPHLILLQVVPRALAAPPPSLSQEHPTLL